MIRKEETQRNKYKKSCNHKNILLIAVFLGAIMLFSVVGVEMVSGAEDECGTTTFTITPKPFNFQIPEQKVGIYTTIVKEKKSDYEIIKQLSIQGYSDEEIAKAIEGVMTGKEGAVKSALRAGIKTEGDKEGVINCIVSVLFELGNAGSGCITLGCDVLFSVCGDESTKTGCALKTSEIPLLCGISTHESDLRTLAEESAKLLESSIKMNELKKMLTLAESIKLDKANSQLVSGLNVDSARNCDKTQIKNLLLVVRNHIVLKEYDKELNRFTGTLEVLNNPSEAAKIFKDIGNCVDSFKNANAEGEAIYIDFLRTMASYNKHNAEMLENPDLSLETERQRDRYIKLAQNYYSLLEKYQIKFTNDNKIDKSIIYMLMNSLEMTKFDSIGKILDVFNSELEKYNDAWVLNKEEAKEIEKNVREVHNMYQARQEGMNRALELQKKAYLASSPILKEEYRKKLLDSKILLLGQMAASIDVAGREIDKQIKKDFPNTFQTDESGLKMAGDFADYLTKTHPYARKLCYLWNMQEDEARAIGSTVKQQNERWKASINLLIALLRNGIDLGEFYSADETKQMEMIVNTLITINADTEVISLKKEEISQCVRILLDKRFNLNNLDYKETTNPPLSQEEIALGRKCAELKSYIFLLYEFRGDSTVFNTDLEILIRDGKTGFKDSENGGEVKRFKFFGGIPANIIKEARFKFLPLLGIGGQLVPTHSYTNKERLSNPYMALSLEQQKDYFYRTELWTPTDIGIKYWMAKGLSGGAINTVNAWTARGSMAGLRTGTGVALGFAKGFVLWGIANELSIKYTGNTAIADIFAFGLFGYQAFNNKPAEFKTDYVHLNVQDGTSTHITRFKSSQALDAFINFFKDAKHKDGTLVADGKVKEGDGWRLTKGGEKIGPLLLEPSGKLPPGIEEKDLLEITEILERQARMNELKSKLPEAKAAPSEPPTPEPGTGCFLANTPIKMADGNYKNIQDILVGEKVSAFDILNMKPATAEVTTTFKRPASGYLEVEYEVEG